nr:MAG TPA: hypothetical protein [Caudoviricetes sp.]
MCSSRTTVGNGERAFVQRKRHTCPTKRKEITRWT